MNPWVDEQVTPILLDVFIHCGFVM